MSKWYEVLFRITTQREERIDALLDRISETEVRTDEVKALQTLVTSEIKASQRLRTVTVGTTVGLVIVGCLAALWIEHQGRKRAHALQYYQTSNLPVIFQNATNGDLRIRFAQDPDAPAYVRSDVMAINQNRAGFGRHPGLGAGRELEAIIDPGFGDGLRYILRPDNDSATIGQLTLTRRSGRLATQEEAIVPGGPPRTFESLRSFALRIESFDAAARAWRIRFCERATPGASFRCAPNSFTINKSRAGRQQEHLLVTDPAWQSVYFVSVGFGEQGEDGKVWTVNARATKLGLVN